ncbi:MAG: hypothetical protein NC305_03515 [Lachnospiraceae bacterium]|nr:hypothetical protein [Butyrivibrio sp.]MCM1343218.1 hypothetical protein [Muribaculaceae bacterium]MCM1409598.1 hypothetical protein [Lachnospiraceae bacterium]
MCDKEEYGMWEYLLLSLLFEMAGFQPENSYENTLNKYFLENPEDEFLLELEFISTDLKKTRIALDANYRSDPQKYGGQSLPADICKKLGEIYDSIPLEEFVPKAHRLWAIMPDDLRRQFPDLGSMEKPPAKKDIPRVDAIYRELFQNGPDGCGGEPRSGTICEANVTLGEYLSVGQGSVEPDFERAELFLGFSLHESVKDFYSRVFAPTVVGTVVLPEKDFTVPIGNKRFDTWFAFHKISGNTEIRLLPCVSEKSAARLIREHFHLWTGGNDFGQRVYIGHFYTNIGNITIVIDNRTGAVEWVDLGYGHYEKYEKNPHGILAESMEGFLRKLECL